jgi:hypothetical protein
MREVFDPNSIPSSERNTAEEHLDVLGYDPIKYEDGKFICPERGEIRPQFPVGNEEHQISLFIEYERTFGRGLAKDVTHSSGTPKYISGTKSEKDFFKRYGDGVIDEYKKLSSLVGLMGIGSQEACEEGIGELREYRKRHPALYSDIKPKGPKKKFSIHQ